jgi:hypothetical protein
VLKQKPTPDCLAAQKQNAIQVLKGNKSASITKKSQRAQKPSNKTSSKMQKPATAQASQKKSWSLFGKKQDTSANGQAPKKKSWNPFRKKQPTVVTPNIAHEAIRNSIPTQPTAQNNNQGQQDDGSGTDGSVDGDDSAPVDDGGDSAPADDGGDSAPVDDGDDSAPADDGGDSAPVDNASGTDGSADGEMSGDAMGQEDNGLMNEEEADPDADMGYGNYNQVIDYYNQAQIDQSYMNGYSSYPAGQSFNQY